MEHDDGLVQVPDEDAVDLQRQVVVRRRLATPPFSSGRAGWWGWRDTGQGRCFERSPRSHSADDSGHRKMHGRSVMLCYAEK